MEAAPFLVTVYERHSCFHSCFLSLLLFAAFSTFLTYKDPSGLGVSRFGWGPLRIPWTGKWTRDHGAFSRGDGNIEVLGC